HVKAGVKSSILFLKKHPKVVTQKFEKTLKDVKAIVQKEKCLDKEQRTERILELYKERIFQFVNDYKVLMIEVENIGYDATGKKITANEFIEEKIKIKEYIEKI